MLSISSTASTGTCNRGKSPLHLLRGGRTSARTLPNVTCGRKSRSSGSQPAAHTTSSTSRCNAPNRPSASATPAQITFRSATIGKATAFLYSRNKPLVPRGNCRQSFPQRDDLCVLSRAEKAQRQMEVFWPHPTHTLRRPQRSHRIAQLAQCRWHPDGDEGATNGHRKPASRRSNTPGSPPQSSPLVPSRTPWPQSLPSWPPRLVPIRAAP